MSVCLSSCFGGCVAWYVGFDFWGRRSGALCDGDGWEVDWGRKEKEKKESSADCGLWVLGCFNAGCDIFQGRKYVEVSFERLGGCCVSWKVTGDVFRVGYETSL